MVDTAGAAPADTADAAADACRASAVAVAAASSSVGGACHTGAGGGDCSAVTTAAAALDLRTVTCGRAVRGAGPHAR